MEITVYKRHSDDCEHRADRAYRRCTCRMMLEWFDKGDRFRVSAKTRSWSEAEQRARSMMQEAHARTIGEQPRRDDLTKRVKALFDLNGLRDPQERNERKDEFIRWVKSVAEDLGLVLEIAELSDGAEIPFAAPAEDSQISSQAVTQ